MNYCLIFAAGSGTRMHCETPKQFIEVSGKPILVHTIDVFQKSSVIDGIIVVTRREYIDVVKQYAKTFSITKVLDVIVGGKTAFESQRIGLELIKKFAKDDDVVFIHDGVRPLINLKLLDDCLDLVKTKGSAITVSPAAETISILDSEGQIQTLLPRQKCMLARAPQVFYFKDIYEAHLKASVTGMEYIDSASMMVSQGFTLNVIEGPAENIKITTQYDLMLLKLWMKEKLNYE